MSTEDTIKNALDSALIGYQQVVEVDPVENDYLITGVKQLPAREMKAAPPKMEGHSVAPGKTIIRRLEDLADSDFERYMRVGTDCGREKTPNVDTSEMGWLDARVEGICECLAVMKNTSRGVEYEDVLDRYQNNITMGDPRPNENG